MKFVTSDNIEIILQMLKKWLPISVGVGNHSVIQHSCEAENDHEVGLGLFNDSHDNTILSIGIGTSEDTRKNAFEIRRNGEIYYSDGEGSMIMLQDMPNKSLSDDEIIQIIK